MINRINNVKASQHRDPTPHILNIPLLLLYNLRMKNTNPLKKMFDSLIWTWGIICIMGKHREESSWLPDKPNATQSFV